jgi:O-antigen ligase
VIAAAPTNFASPRLLLDRLAGDRPAPDRALLVLAIGMAALSFSNPAWQSLHAIGWIVVLAASAGSRRWIVPGPVRWVVPWGLFAAWVLLAEALGPHPSTGKIHNLPALFLFGTALRGARDLVRALAATCFVLSIQAAYGLWQFAGSTDHIVSRAKGTLSHHMTYSGMLLLTLCLVLPLLPRRRGRAGLLWWGYAIAALAALLATLTRSAWLGLAAALALWIAFENPRWLPALPVAAAALVVAVPGLRERAASIVDARDYSNVHRLSIYPTGLRMIEDNPWLGAGGRRPVRERYPDYEGPPPTPPPLPDGTPRQPYRTPPHLHNDLLQIAAAWGLPALAAWLAALAVYAREAWRLLPARRDAGEAAARLRRSLILGSLCATAGFLTMGMFEDNFGDSEVSVLFFLTLSIPWILGRERPATAGAAA